MNTKAMKRLLAAMLAQQPERTDAGMALEQVMTMSASGEGPRAAIMNRMGKLTITTVVDSIQAGDLAADLFEIPAGFKVKQN